MLHKRGATPPLTATLFSHPPHAKISHQDVHTCAHSVNTASPVAPQMPPRLFLSICGDRMTIRPPATRTQPCCNTHTCAHTYTRAGEAPQKSVASLLKTSVALVCLISFQTEQQAGLVAPTCDRSETCTLVAFR